MLIKPLFTNMRIVLIPSFFLLISMWLHSCVIIHEDFCAHNPQTVQCRLLTASNREQYPNNEHCDPFDKKDCKLFDVVDSDIAACELQHTEYQGRREFGEHLLRSPVAKCFTVYKTYINIYKEARVNEAYGDVKCMPSIHNKRLICGERGTRCVCHDGTKICHCQWFTDYCLLPGICEGSDSCETTINGLQCKGGSINQCQLNPTLCQDQNKYCVDLPDKDMIWKSGFEVEGYGFSCIDKGIFKKITTSAPFCNFNRTDQKLSGEGFKPPINDLDYCCYEHLTCVQKNSQIGGFLFKPRPCYCNVEFRKCVQKVGNDRKFKKLSHGLISILNQDKLCTQDNGGRCNPKSPKDCHKGDLIEPSIAHCKINCHTGPLLPIEKRSCRIRKCIPPNNLKDTRVIDVPHHRESSRCEAVEGLSVTCGFENTRCVCDGRPIISYFTDSCRCQYWSVE